MDSKDVRCCGVLLHPTSLYSPYGIGDLGPACYDFIDALYNAEVRLWQILPLGPTGYGNSPYSARSAFAGNELLLSPILLVENGYLAEKDLSSSPRFPSSKIDFDAVKQWKIPLLKKAANNFLSKSQEKQQFTSFCQENQYWLDDYALFMVLYEKYQDARWSSCWDRDVAKREKKTIARISMEKKQEILEWKTLQFFFDQQWKQVKRYANARDIKIIGDIPIFVAADSVDTWSNLSLFKTDKEGHYTEVSGVPPDNFCTTGQLWGNPVYDWKAMRKSSYSWWIRRLERLRHQTDIIRIDHFRGFESYWSVPAKDTTAEHGVWVKAPGHEFFHEVRKQLGDVDILAEDLGFVTKEVEQLRDENNFPGMRIAQFGFNLSDKGILDSLDTFLPHNYQYNCVAYTGTHDNETTQGWFDHQSPEGKKAICSYLACTSENVVWSLIRAVMASHAHYAIFPLQDILGLGNQARMNTPSTCSRENWSWQLEEKTQLRDPLEKLRELVLLYGRFGSNGDSRHS
ncbi:MAG: 4-alpha-glucanotransferase [Sphaerochaetaceae bacterium]